MVIRWAWLLSNQTISCFTNRIPMRQKIPANHKRKEGLCKRLTGWRRMADGGWRMADGGWRMADGGWRMADNKMRIIK